MPARKFALIGYETFFSFSQSAFFPLWAQRPGAMVTSLAPPSRTEHPPALKNDAAPGTNPDMMLEIPQSPGVKVTSAERDLGKE